MKISNYSHLEFNIIIRSGTGACAGAERRCVYFPPVLQGPPSGPSPRQMPGPSPSPRDADHPAATTSHVVGPLASSTHEAPSLRESGEQDQHQETEQHVHTAQLMLTDYAGNKSHLSLSATARWTQSLTSDSQGFSEETWYQRN